MKALVTGAAGFVGRHMTRELMDRGYEVDMCDIEFTDEYVDFDEHVSKDANFLFMHNTKRYDLVVHAAATAPFRAAIDNQPANLVYDMHLDAAMFDWAIGTGQKHVVYLSSSAAYPVGLQRRLDTSERLAEGDIDLDYPEQPDGRYGVAKLAGEHMARAAIEVGLPVTVVRPFSGYGEDQGDDWPFGAFIKRIKERQVPTEIWGAADQQRDWIHISDVVNGILAIVDNWDTSIGPVNLCTGIGTEIGHLVDFMQAEAEWKEYEKRYIGLRDKPLGVMRRVGDPTLFRAFYTPKVTIEEGVRRALAYEKEFDE
jgi:nucleoside-diphosphate-sugar epimerase